MKKLILTLEEQKMDLSDKPLRHRKISISGVVEIEKMKEYWLEYAVKELVDKFNEVIYEDTGFTTFEDKLADHDKEVRKQVCDEIRKVYVGYNVSRFNDFLDQIEKEDEK